MANTLRLAKKGVMCMIVVYSAHTHANNPTLTFMDVCKF